MTLGSAARMLCAAWALSAKDMLKAAAMASIRAAVAKRDFFMTSSRSCLLFDPDPGAGPAGKASGGMSRKRSLEDIPGRRAQQAN